MHVHVWSCNKSVIACLLLIQGLNRWMLVTVTALLDEEADRELLLPNTPLLGFGHMALFKSMQQLARLAAVCMDR